MLNRVYAMALVDKEEKDRAETINELWAPEPGELEAAMDAMAEFARRAGAVVDE